MSFTVKVLGEKVGKGDSYVFTDKDVKWGRIIKYISFPDDIPHIALLKPKLELSEIVLAVAEGDDGQRFSVPLLRNQIEIAEKSQSKFNCALFASYDNQVQVIDVATLAATATFSLCGRQQLWNRQKTAAKRQKTCSPGDTTPRKHSFSLAVSQLIGWSGG